MLTLSTTYRLSGNMVRFVNAMRAPLEPGAGSHAHAEAAPPLVASKPAGACVHL